MGRGEGEDGVKMGGGVLHVVFLVFIFQIPLGNLPPSPPSGMVKSGYKMTVFEGSFVEPYGKSLVC